MVCFGAFGTSTFYQTPGRFFQFSTCYKPIQYLYLYLSPLKLNNIVLFSLSHTHFPSCNILSDSCGVILHNSWRELPLIHFWTRKGDPSNHGVNVGELLSDKTPSISMNSIIARCPHHQAPGRQGGVIEQF